MTPEWKDASGADVGEVALPDGRVLGVMLLRGFGWSGYIANGDAGDCAMLGMKFGVQSRAEAIAAVERAAGVANVVSHQYQAEWNAMRANADAPESFDAMPPDGWVPPWLEHDAIRPPLRIVESAHAPAATRLGTRIEPQAYEVMPRDNPEDAPQTPLEASVVRDDPPRSPPLFCIQRPTVRCGEAWKNKEHPCAVAGYECMSDSDTMRYEAAQPSERAMGFAEGVEAAFLDDEEVVRLRAEVKSLTEYADLYAQAHRALDEAREQRDAALADLRDARALAFRALTRITPLSGSQRIMVLGWEKYESAFAFGADGSGK